MEHSKCHTREWAVVIDPMVINTSGHSFRRFPIIAAVFCVATLLNQPRLHAQSTVASLTLDVDPTISSSSLLRATVKLTNNSNHSVLASSAGVLHECEFIVKSSSGDVVPLTRYGNQVTSALRLDFSTTRHMLLSGVSSTFSFPLNRLYDMAKPGTYSVNVSRTIFDPTTKNRVSLVSNTSTVQILEPTESKSVVEPDMALATDVNPFPSKLWKIGDTWKAIVEVFKTSSPMAANQPVVLNFGSGPVPNDPVMVIDTYPMTIKVVGVQKLPAGDQAAVQFLPDEGAPSYIHGRAVEVVVDRHTNQLLEVTSQNLKTGDVVEKLDEKLVLVRPINGYAVGFPCDIIPISSLLKGSSSSQLMSPDKTMSLSISKTDVDEDEVWSEKLSVRDKDWFRVTQKWVKGQKWWSQYVKEDFDSQIGMRATTIGNSEITFGVPDNGLQLGLGSEDALAIGGEAVHLRVALRNSTDKDIALKPVLIGSNFNLTVAGAGQPTVPLTIAGKEAAVAPVSLFDKQVLPAHSTIYRDLLLSRNYDLSLNGNYSVSATASQLVEGENSKLASPNLNVRIIG